MTCCFPSKGRAQEWLRAQDSHAWARFQPESWKSVRVSHSLLDSTGKVTSEVITLTTTELNEASRNQYTLSVESTVKIGEQRVNQSKQRIKRDINAKGEGFSDVVKADTIKIGDYEMPVEVFTVEYSTKKGKRVSKVYISRETMPSVLRRETAFTNKKGDKYVYSHDKAFNIMKSTLQNLPCWEKYKSYTATNNIPLALRGKELV